MRLVTVIPISRGVAREELSYFTKEKLQPGSLVRVSLRFRKIPAIVLKTENAASQKTTLKSRSYTIKKLDSVTSQEFLNPSFFEVVETLKDYYVATAGSVLDQLIPKAVLDTGSKTQTTKASKGVFKEFVLQDTPEKRIEYYKDIVVKTMKEDGSVFILAPTIVRAKILHEMVSENIENTYLLHSKLTKKKVLEKWTEVLENKNPVVVIATGSFLSLPRNDFHAFILDNERSRNYKNISRPFIDIRTAVRFLAKQTGSSCIYADTMLRTETLFRYKQKEIKAYKKIQTNYPTGEPLVVDMRGDKNKKHKALLFSPELLQLVEKNSTKKDHLFLFVARRGLAPISVCDDCGMTQHCAQCSAPVALHTKKEKRVFICHHCGTERGVNDSCENCGSWKLTTLGIGTELVGQKMKEVFPEMTVIRADSDTTKSQSAIERVLKEWRGKENSVLIGTELVLPHLSKDDTVAVVSLDSLFSLPDFRIHERAFGLLTEISVTSKKLALVQTRSPHHKILEHLKDSNIEAFYKNEIQERKKFDYPPFATLIKLTAAGKKALELLREVQNKVTPYDLSIFQAFRRVVRGKEVHNALITMPLEDWPKERLVKILKALPAEIAIDVDPHNVL